MKVKYVLANLKALRKIRVNYLEVFKENIILIRAKKFVIINNYE